MKTIWTPDRDQAIVEIMAAGGNRVDVAAALGVTEYAAQSRMHRIRVMGLRGVSPATKEACHRRSGEGWRVTRIARQVGLPPYLVEAILVGTEPAEEIVDAPYIKKLARFGLTAGQIAEEAGVSRATVERIAGHLLGRRAA